MTAQPEGAKNKTITGGRQVGKSEMEGAPLGSAYDERNFYVAATDKNHQKTTIKLENGKTLAVPVWLAVEIRKMVDSELTPYRYEYDLVRDGLVHLIVKLHKYKGTPPAEWEAFMEMAEMEREASEAQWQEDQVRRVQELMDHALRKGDKQLFASTQNRGNNLLKKLRSPYKEELQKSLNVTNIGQP